MLIEFKYGAVPDETFCDQSKPRQIFYTMKKELFPTSYWLKMPYGTWFGRDTKFFGIGFTKAQ